MTIKNRNTELMKKIFKSILHKFNKIFNHGDLCRNNYTLLNKIV